MSHLLKPRPSALPHLEVCPRWTSRPDDPGGKKDGFDLAAEEGTLIHAKLEGLAEIPTQDWDRSVETDPAIGPALTPAVLAAAAQVRDLFDMVRASGLPVVTARGLGVEKYELADVFPKFGDGAYCEAGVDPEVTRPGTGDLFVVLGKRAVYTDYKSNRVARVHDAQMKAYVVGLFKAVPALENVEVRIVAPRLQGVHEPMFFGRDDVPALEAELSGIVSRAEDPYEPGCPGDDCAMCAGNGRCVWQVASLRDVPVPAAAVVSAGQWAAMLKPVSPELRGTRRQIVKWLEKFAEAVKEDDKAWALAFPDAVLPGFKKSVSAGRSSLDKTRYAEANAALMAAFGLDPVSYLAFAEPDASALAEYVGLNLGLSGEASKAKVAEALAPYMKRGADVIKFLPQKKPSAALPA